MARLTRARAVMLQGHGVLFGQPEIESGAVRRSLLEWGTGAPGRGGATLDHRTLREAAYDRLADTLRGVLDIGALHRLLRLPAV